MAAKLGFKNVIHICEDNHYIRDYISSCAIHNNIHDCISLQSSDWLTTADLSNVSAVIAEPHFTVSVLPWHNFLFWFILDKLSLPSTIKIIPGKARMYCVPVHYVDLWKIRAPLHHVEGFKMNHFDKIIEAASNISDNNVEPHPLWEYPSIALGPPVQILEFDLNEKISEKRISFKGSCQVLDDSRILNGMALWMEWQLDDENLVSGQMAFRAFL